MEVTACNQCKHRHKNYKFNSIGDLIHESICKAWPNKHFHPIDGIYFTYPRCIDANDGQCDRFIKKRWWQFWK